MIHKQSCVIAVSEKEDKPILFKIRDRKYVPKLRVYHELINGVEVLYVKDEITAWIEGINEYGIGVINSALLVKQDENEHLNPIRRKRQGRVMSRDGNRVLKILASRNIEEALDMTLKYDEGIKGHTFISDGTTTYAVEHTSKLKPKHRKLRGKATHVRTNHGILHPGAGYKGGPSLDSSVKRKEMVERILKRSEKIKDISPDIFNESLKSKHDFNSAVRLEGGEMFTSSLMALNLKELKILLYILEERGDFLGYRNNINGQTKCTFDVYRFNKKNKIERLGNKPDQFVEDVSRDM